MYPDSDVDFVPAIQSHGQVQWSSVITARLGDQTEPGWLRPGVVVALNGGRVGFLLCAFVGRP